MIQKNRHQTSVRSPDVHRGSDSIGDVRHQIVDFRLWTIIITILLSTFNFQLAMPILRMRHPAYECIGTVLWAQETRTEEPILITSDKVEYLDKKKEGEFVGNVKAIQGKLTLTSSRVKVVLEPDGKKIKQIIATGKVKLVQEDLIATSEQALFYNEEQKVVMTGSPQAFSRKNKFSGEKITVYLKDNRIVIETKVKGVIVQE